MQPENAPVGGGVAAGRARYCWSCEAWSTRVTGDDVLPMRIGCTFHIPNQFECYACVGSDMHHGIFSFLFAVDFLPSPPPSTFSIRLHLGPETDVILHQATQRAEYHKGWCRSVIPRLSVTGRGYMMFVAARTDLPKPSMPLGWSSNVAAAEPSMRSVREVVGCIDKDIEQIRPRREDRETEQRVWAVE